MRATGGGGRGEGEGTARAEAQGIERPVEGRASRASGHRGPEPWQPGHDEEAKGEASSRLQLRLGPLLREAPGGPFARQPCLPPRKCQHQPLWVLGVALPGGRRWLDPPHTHLPSPPCRAVWGKDQGLGTAPPHPTPLHRERAPRLVWKVGSPPEAQNSPSPRPLPSCSWTPRPTEPVPLSLPAAPARPSGAGRGGEAGLARPQRPGGGRQGQPQLQHWTPRTKPARPTGAGPVQEVSCSPKP